MIPNNLRSRDMVGMEVLTSRAIKNGLGIVIPKGSTVKIASFGRDFTIKSEPCPCCGMYAYVSGITRKDVELLKDD